MTFSGIHFLVAHVGRACAHLVDNLPPPTFLHLADSEHMEKPGLSRLVGPNPHGKYGYAIVRVTAAKDSYVTFGENPEAPDAPRALVLAGRPQDFVLRPNTKIMWNLA
jgi:hypothetical protein